VWMMVSRLTTANRPMMIKACVLHTQRMRCCLLLVLLRTAKAGASGAVFFPKGRCSNGFNCPFCHFAHEKRKSGKTKKKKNRRRKQRPNSWQADLALPLRPPLVQDILGNSMSWGRSTNPRMAQKPSRLIVHNLQFVPSATLPGHSIGSQSNAAWLE